jgi:hypothetical protein
MASLDTHSDQTAPDVAAESVEASDGLLTQRYPEVARAVAEAGRELKARGMLEIKTRLDKEVSELLGMSRAPTPGAYNRA